MSSLNVRIKRRAGTVAAGLALSAVALAMAPGVAGAQDAANGAPGAVRGLQASPDATIQSSPAGDNGGGLVGSSTGAMGATVEPTAVGGEAPSSDPLAVDAQDAAEAAAPVVGIEGGTGLASDVSPAPVAYDDAPSPAGSTAYGSVDGTVGVGAPIVPVAVGAQVDAGAQVEPVAGLDVCFGLGVNQATGECNGAVAPAAGDPVPVEPVAIPALPVVEGSPGGQEENVAAPGVDTSGSLGTVALSDAVDLNNTNISPQVSVLGGSNEAGAAQYSGGGPATGDPGGVATSDSLGTVALNDGLDVNNTNVNPQISVLDGSNAPGTGQAAEGSGGGSGHDASGGGVTKDDSLVTVGVNDAVDANNTNVSPQLSMLGGSNESSAEQDSGFGSASGDSSGVATDGSVGTIGVNDGVDANNTNVAPQVSVLDGSNESDTEQTAGGSDAGHDPGTVDTNGSLGTVGVDDAVDLNNTNGAPQVSVLDGSNGAGVEQNGDGTPPGTDSGGVATGDSVVTIGANDAIDAKNTNVAPQVAALDGSNESDATQQGPGEDGAPGTGSGGVDTSGSVGIIGANDLVDLGNTNTTPQVSVLDGSNKSNAEQSTGGGAHDPSPTDPGPGEVPDGVDGEVPGNEPGEVPDVGTGEDPAHGPGDDPDDGSGEVPGENLGDGGSISGAPGDGGTTPGGHETPGSDGGNPLVNHVSGDEDEVPFGGAPFDGPTAPAPVSPAGNPRLPEAFPAALGGPVSPTAAPVLARTTRASASPANAADGIASGSSAGPESGAPSEAEREPVSTPAEDPGGVRGAAANAGTRTLLLPDTGGVEFSRAFLLGLPLLLLGIAVAFAAKRGSRAKA